MRALAAEGSESALLVGICEAEGPGDGVPGTAPKCTAWLARVTVIGVIFVQFLAPLLHLYYPKSLPSMKETGAQCSYACDSCRDTSWFDRLEPQYFANGFFDCSNHFYTREADRCLVRTSERVELYVAQQECGPELVIHDESSCEAAAMGLLASHSVVHHCGPDSNTSAQDLPMFTNVLNFSEAYGMVSMIASPAEADFSVDRFVFFSNKTGCMLETRFREWLKQAAKEEFKLDSKVLSEVERMSDSGVPLSVCFTKPVWRTHAMCLISALCSAMVLSKLMTAGDHVDGTAASQGGAPLEVDSEQCKAAILKGSWQLAVASEAGIVKMTKALLFRACALIAIGGVATEYSLAMRPWILLLSFAMTVVPFVIWHHSLGAWMVPTCSLAPPEVSVLRSQMWTCKVRCHWLVIWVSYILSIVLFFALLRSGTPVFNTAAFTTFFSQPGALLFYGLFWTLMILVLASVYWGIVLVNVRMSFFKEVTIFGENADERRAFVLYSQIRQAAMLRLAPASKLNQHEQGTPMPLPVQRHEDSDHSDDDDVDRLCRRSVAKQLDLAAKSLDTIAVEEDALLRARRAEQVKSMLAEVQIEELKRFPEGVEPLGWLDVLKPFVLFCADVVTDVVAWTGFFTAGHHYFGFVLATVSWTSTLVQFRRGLWQRLPQAIEASRIAGVRTADFNDLLDAEKGFEAMFSSVIQTYGFYYTGLTGWAYFSSMLSIWLSIYGLSSFMVDKYDIGEPPSDECMRSVLRSSQPSAASPYSSGGSTSSKMSSPDASETEDDLTA